MDGHTAGPWHAHRYIGREDNWYVLSERGVRVCGRGCGPVSSANARLISAAPELLEALENLLAECPDAWSRHGAQAAIAKASGKTLPAVIEREEG